MIENYIFDFGRVLVDFEPEKMTAAYVTDPADVESVSTVMFDRLYWSRLDDGTITDDEVKRLACARLPERLHEQACAVYDHWLDNLPQISGMYELVRSLHEQGKPLYLLSNISKGFAERYPQIPALNRILSLFDGRVFSGPIGLVKPDAAIYRYLLDRYSLKAESCLFIDDNADNIAAAGRLGIHTYLFDGSAERLSRFLSEL